MDRDAAPAEAGDDAAGAPHAARRPAAPSLEEMLRAREEQQRQASRPVFVSRAERERRALERLRQARGRQREGNDGDRPHAAATGPADGGQAQPMSAGARALMESERRALDERLGGKVLQAKKPRVSSEKFKFKFEWETSDDTSLEADPFYKHLAKTKATQLSKTRPVPSSTHRVSHSLPSALRDARHWSEKPRRDMTERDWRIFKEDYSIALRGGGADKALLPARKWNETGLPTDILELVHQVGYENPSPIQMASIPIGIHGRDLIGLAETGSGKTAAFVLPLLVALAGLPELTPARAALGPYALIMAPTRELTQQIEVETIKFASRLGYRVCSVVGGLSIEAQGLQLQRGCHIVIATPGRMIDCLERHFCVLNQCCFVVLDEADRMIDMGFEPQVQDILDAIPKSNLKPEDTDVPGRAVAAAHNKVFRQTFMFSATMPASVERLARTFLRRPVVVAIGETGKSAVNVDQRVEFYSSEPKKRDRLIHLIRTCEPPIIVFVNTKRGCDVVAKALESSSKIRPVVLHSGKSQEQREGFLDGFREGRYPVLVATDVLGRGIDIKGVNHVINYELPTKIEPYTHRIGRTGRAGRKGTAWSLATAADSAIFPDLKKQLDEAKVRCPPEIAHHESVRGRGVGGFSSIVH